MGRLVMFFLVVLVAILSGCATTAHVTMDSVSANNTTFKISYNENDPLNVASVISDEISKRGYKVRVFHPEAISNQKPEPIAVFGSGFFVSKEGVVISNAHVVKGASTITIRKTDGEKFMAKVLVADEKNDIAILQPLESVSVAKWLSFEQFKNVKIGDRLLIVGFPLSGLLGKHPRVTDGIISAKVGLMDDPTRFQVSASIQPGNSGGPILNKNFQVIGVATEKLSDVYAIQQTGSIPQNVNFGVKIDYVKMIFNEDIDYSVDSNTPQIDSLDDAIEATVLIATNVADIPESTPIPNPEKRILITFNYYSYWDLIHHSMHSFSIQWIDESNGEVVASGNFSGDTPQSYVGIVQGVLKEIFTKAGM